jgi:predicted nucleic acid-binding protein
MAGETALDTSIAIRYLNGDQIVVGLEHGWKLATDDAHFGLVDGLEIERW